MTHDDTPLQRRDPYEYPEGPKDNRRLFTLPCEECGRSFTCADPDAKRCPKCLWRKIKDGE